MTALHGGAAAREPIFWAKLRQDVVTLVEANKLSSRDLGVYAFLCARARDGKTWTSRASLARKFPRDFKTERQAKDVLRRLQSLGLIESERDLGSRGNYPVLIADLERFASRRELGPHRGPQEAQPGSANHAETIAPAASDGPHARPPSGPQGGPRSGPRPGPPYSEIREEEEHTPDQN